MYVFLGPKSNEEPESVFKMPAGVGRRSLFVVSLPIKVLLYLTVPDCRRPRWRKYVILTFSLSLVWLSVFSYIMVWMITVIGNTLTLHSWCGYCCFTTCCFTNVLYIPAVLFAYQMMHGIMTRQKQMIDESDSYGSALY